VLTFEPLGEPSLTSGRRLQSFEDTDTERPPYASVAGRNHNRREQFHHLPFSPVFPPASEDSPNSLLLRILTSDESPPPTDLSPWTDSASGSPMEDHPQHNHDATVRLTAPHLGSVVHNDLPASYYPFNDPQISSSSSPTRAGPSHAGSYFPQSMTAPVDIRDQGRPQCTFAPVQTLFYPLAYEQTQPQHRQRHESLPTQRVYHSDARDNSAVSASSYSQHSNSPDQHHRNQARISSDLLESPNWSTGTDLGSGRSLSVSQLEGTDSGDSYISEHTDGSSGSHAESYNAQPYRRYTRDEVEWHDADDEGSDTMSDGIASNEGVYSSSGSDRDVFDDEDYDSSEVDSDEEYEYSPSSRF
jgi:hypothetical protein